MYAILAGAYNAFGELDAAAAQVQRSIDLVTTELVPTTALAADESRSIDVATGRTYAILIAAAGGETTSIASKSRDFWCSIAVLLAPRRIAGRRQRRRRRLLRGLSGGSPRRLGRTCSRSARWRP
jgi:hypothetical protein